MFKRTAFLSVVAAVAFAQQPPAPRVGVVAYCSQPTSQYNPQNAVQTLQNDGRFSSVSLILGDASSPTLQTLQNGYECVVAITDAGCGIPMPDAIATSASNTLAAYANSGRGVVITPFSFAQPRPSLGLDSALFAPGLSPLRGTSITNSPFAGAIDTQAMSNAPACANIRDGVSGSPSSSFANDVELSQDATRCVSYVGGLPLVALNPTGKVVGFNSFPSDAAPHVSASYRRLFANAVLQACSVSTSQTFTVSVQAKQTVWNLKSKAPFSVTVMGTQQVPAASIDAASVRLAGIAPTRAVLSGGNLDLRFDSEALAQTLPPGLVSNSPVSLILTGRAGANAIQGQLNLLVR